MERYKKFIEIMARPYVTEQDLTAAGIKQGSQLSEVLAYSHKLRLAGCDKADSLRQSLAYARKVLKIDGVDYEI